MIYVLTITCFVLAVLLALVIGYHVGKIAKEVKEEVAYEHAFLDLLEQACMELEKPRWFDIISDKMLEISKRKEEEK